MKPHLFEAMTEEKAKDYLNEFLAFGRSKGMRILEENLHFTKNLDFRIETLPDILRALIPSLVSVPRDSDLTLPAFIRNTEDYQKGLFDFDKKSNSLILAAAFYLGETFITQFSHLYWDTGNSDFREGNMPVVRPFANDIEMAPILIVENLYRRIVIENSRREDVDKAIKLWIEDATRK